MYSQVGMSSILLETQWLEFLLALDVMIPQLEGFPYSYQRTSSADSVVAHQRSIFGIRSSSFHRAEESDACHTDASSCSPHRPVLSHPLWRIVLLSLVSLSNLSSLFAFRMNQHIELIHVKASKFSAFQLKRRQNTKLVSKAVVCRSSQSISSKIIDVCIETGCLTRLEAPRADLLSRNNR
jgi:hypothetical protein